VPRFVTPLVLIVLTAVGALVAAGCSRTRTPAAPTAASADGGNATVDRVVDGDTIRVVAGGGRSERVRLIGVDTPETKDPRRPVQCFGKEASAFTAKLLPHATRVRLVRDVEGRDRYGRLLAYVYRARDGLFVNLALAEGGYARTLTIPPNVAHVDEFVAAVRVARDERRGLWGRCADPARDPPASS
jgi:micrococcal nuclease